jgi:acyl-CoA dehydrogenase
MIDFSLPGDLIDMRDKVTASSMTRSSRWSAIRGRDPHGPEEELRREMVHLAREAKLLSSHGPREWGGLRPDHRGMAVVFEAAGWSPLGQLALNIQAPDEGNTNLLNKVATPAQKERKRNVGLDR